MAKKGCQCFICRYSEDKELLKAYLTGFKEASEPFLNWAKEHKLELGTLGGDKLEDLYAEIYCNYNETLCLMSELGA